MQTPDNVKKLTSRWFQKYKPTNIRQSQLTSVFQSLECQALG